MQSVGVALDAGDEAGVAGDLAAPAPLEGVVEEGLGVGELASQLGEERAAGLVGHVSAQVRVPARRQLGAAHSRDLARLATAVPMLLAGTLTNPN